MEEGSDDSDYLFIVDLEKKNATIKVKNFGLEQDGIFFPINFIAS